MMRAQRLLASSYSLLLRPSHSLILNSTLSSSSLASPAVFATTTTATTATFGGNGSFFWHPTPPLSGPAPTPTSTPSSRPLSTVSLAKESPSLNPLPRDVVLYQYQACPFCNKVNAFLDYHDIPYKVVEVNPLSKKEIKWSDYKKVPILNVDGEVLVDSSDIIDKLSRKIHPETPIVDDEENKWRRWVDDQLVHVLSPNIYRNISEALESFDYITTHGNFSFTERLTVKYAGAAAMYFVSKKLKKKHNITNERAALYEVAERWVDALNGRNFLGGSKPNLADLAVFGVLRPIRYLKAGRDMVDNTRIGDWYACMENAVRKSSRITS